MDDPRTTEAFEQLAALYLTGTHDAAPPAEGSPPLRLAGDEAHEPMPPADAIDPIDVPPTPAEIGAVEGVLIGHLPGFANLWLGQYAHRLARARGPVVVATIHDHSIELELYTQPADDALLRDMVDAPHWPIERVMAVLAQRAGAMLVRLPATPCPTSRALAHRLDAWTLLSGSDEAAVIGGYRLLKGLIEGLPAGSVLPRVRLVVCGCDRFAAEAAAERLHRTAAEFLHITPTLAGTQQKMEPVRKKRLGNFNVHDPWKFLNEMVYEAAEPAESEIEETPPLELDEGDLLVDEELAALDAYEDVEPLETIETEVRNTESEAAPVEAVPNGDPVTPQPATRNPQSMLVEYIEGLAALEARCPSHELVELAIDPSGGLHLLARTTDDPRATLAAVFDTRSWAQEHAKLLALTVPGRSLDTQRPPTVHLFTDQPKPFGDLAHRGTPDNRPIKLHLLLPVTVGGATTWSHVELN